MARLALFSVWLFFRVAFKASFRNLSSLILKMFVSLSTLVARKELKNIAIFGSRTPLLAMRKSMRPISGPCFR